MAEFLSPGTTGPLFMPTVKAQPKPWLTCTEELQKHAVASASKIQVATTVIYLS